ncbi:MAG: carboxypeptidase-like regulatory domain-containing protein [Bacteroides sp.]|nr:carboxypeptidase-like regulatory domain-containing protein [Ruminococcus flavefaciens]MCM1555369.1 carboxypeptidase-like regulatory domain-containing protein [Bacteroides sp.]
MKRLFKWLIPVAALLLTVSCKSTETEPDNFGAIYGTIADVDTEKPLPEAYVTLSPGGKTASSGEDGTFEFPDQEPQQYTITVQKSGYQTNRKSLTVEACERVEVNITLQKNS